MKQQVNALHRQIGGDHYRNKAIQPVEFATANVLDPCAFSVLNYVTRHREKDGRRDVQKARHFVELRKDLGASWLSAPAKNREFVIDFVTYCQANRMVGYDVEALFALEKWILGVTDERPLLAALDQILTQYDEPAADPRTTPPYGLGA